MTTCYMLQFSSAEEMEAYVKVHDEAVQVQKDVARTIVDLDTFEARAKEAEAEADGLRKKVVELHNEVLVLRGCAEAPEKVRAEERKLGLLRARVAKAKAELKRLRRSICAPVR